jgi:hypothetical protein
MPRDVLAFDAVRPLKSGNRKDPVQIRVAIPAADPPGKLHMPS